MRLCLLAVMLALSACQLALPGKTVDVRAAKPITAGQITVTPLDGPPAPPDPAPPDPASPDPGPTDAQPAAKPTSQPAAQPAAQPAPTPPTPPRAPAKSAAEIACDKTKGIWITAGNTGTKTCQQPLRDSGKQCSRDKDCEGQCLARSRTCAPFAPMFGCNDVLQDNGQRATLCID